MNFLANKSIRYLILDFGGTLDNNGLSWRARFNQAWTSKWISDSDNSIFQEIFNEAEYRISTMPVNEIPCTFAELLDLHLHFQIDSFKSRHAPLEEYAMLDLQCYWLDRIYSSLSNTLKCNFDHFPKDLEIFVASNFFGTLEQCLQHEVGAAFSRLTGIVDSGVIGVRKPDPEFYVHLIEKFDIDPSQAIFVGDSPRNDIEAPGKLGFFTAKIGGRTDDPCKPDIRIDGLSDFLKVCGS